MTPTPDIDALIARVESASEGSRELDGEIWCALGNVPFVKWDGGGCVWRDTIGIRHTSSENVGKYSTSIEAALMLVPEGVEFEISNVYGQAMATVGLNFADDMIVGGSVRSDGNIPLAIVAAALRARQGDKK